MGLYTKVPTQECYNKTGKAPITVRWIDINKGDSINPNYRSRLVAREINSHKKDDLFAGTPPLEALKSIISMTASGNKGGVIMANDVSRAFFQAKACREVYVQLTDEDRLLGEEGKCSRLNYFMYGTRDAAQNWAKEYANMLVDIGFTQGQASPCVIYHRERNIRTFVHGDDYVSTAMPKQLEWLKIQLEGSYQIKTQWLGPGDGYSQEVKILNRVVGWDNAKGLTFEADPRHAEIIINQLKLSEAKMVFIPGTKDEGTTTADCELPLDEQQASQYRAIIARCKYITLDRPDPAFAVKELARRMAKPINGDWIKRKRLGRYLLAKPRMQQVYQWQDPQRSLKTYTDADWAGCRDTRKSTIGGCVMLGAHILKGWSKTQALIALSSGESELYAALKASAETLGSVALLKDLGYGVSGEVWGDASAALGIINRRGLGKTRHIDQGLLWIQQTAAEQRFKYHKVLGKENPADLYTKHLDVATSNLHTSKFGYIFIEGRSTQAPQLHVMAQSLDECRNGDARELCEWVQIIMSHVGKSRSQKKSIGGANTMYNEGSQDACSCRDNWDNMECTTEVWQRVLWGSKQREQGFNGSNAAQLDCPQGTTLTFQLNAGVPCVTGLRHGVTMHPRERHLRGVRIPLPHGLTNSTAREQQPTTQSTYNCNQWEPWYNGINRGDGIRPYKERQDISSKWRYRYNVFPCEKQVGELYYNQRGTNLVKSDMEMGRGRVQPMDYVRADWVPIGHRATWCRRVTETSGLCQMETTMGINTGTTTTTIVNNNCQNKMRRAGSHRMLLVRSMATS